MADQGKKADIGLGITIEYDSNTYYLVSLDTAFNITADDIENVHSGLVDKFKEFFAGLKDAGEVACTINHDPDHVPRVGSPNATIKINFPVPAGKSTGAKFTCDSYIKTFSATRGVPEKGTANVTWKLSGKPTFTPSS